MNGNNDTTAQEMAMQEPKSVAEKQQYIVMAKKFLADEGMSSKLDFAEFMIHYTSHHNELNWKFEEIGALSVLNAKWKQADESSTIQYYYKMERFHEVLNARLLAAELEEDQDDMREIILWKTYIHGFKQWIETALLHQYKIQQFELSE